MDFGTVQISDFEPLLQQTFRADLAGQVFELTLIETHTAPDRRSKPRARPAFSLLFRGRRE